MSNTTEQPRALDENDVRIGHEGTRRLSQIASSLSDAGSRMLRNAAEGVSIVCGCGSGGTHMTKATLGWAA